MNNEEIVTKAATTNVRLRKEKINFYNRFFMIISASVLALTLVIGWFLWFTFYPDIIDEMFEIVFETALNKQFGWKITVDNLTILVSTIVIAMLVLIIVPMTFIRNKTSIAVLFSFLSFVFVLVIIVGFSLFMAIGFNAFKHYLDNFPLEDSLINFLPWAIVLLCSFWIFGNSMLLMVSTTAKQQQQFVPHMSIIEEEQLASIPNPVKVEENIIIPEQIVPQYQELEVEPETNVINIPQQPEPPQLNQPSVPNPLLDQTPPPIHITVTNNTQSPTTTNQSPFDIVNHDSSISPSSNDKHLVTNPSINNLEIKADDNVLNTAPPTIETTPTVATATINETITSKPRLSRKTSNKESSSNTTTSPPINQSDNVTTATTTQQTIPTAATTTQTTPTTATTTVNEATTPKVKLSRKTTKKESINTTTSPPINQSDDAAIPHVWAADQIKSVWEKGQTIPGVSNKLYRKDYAGAWMFRDSFTNTIIFEETTNTRTYSWTIVQHRPLSHGGNNDLYNLHPMNIINAQCKGDDYPRWKTKLSSSGNENVLKDQIWKART